MEEVMDKHTVYMDGVCCYPECPLVEKGTVMFVDFVRDVVARIDMQWGVEDVGGGKALQLFHYCINM
jgi:hypothetical protein